MRNVLRTPRIVLVLIGLAAPAASALTSAAAQPSASLAAPAAPSHAAAPGLYHMPIIDPVVIPGVSGLSSILGGRADATDVQSANWSGFANVAPQRAGGTHLDRRVQGPSAEGGPQSSSGPACAKPWRIPWPARAVSCSGS
jgi:hypothetical protein